MNATSTSIEAINAMMDVVFEYGAKFANPVLPAPYKTMLVGLNALTDGTLGIGAGGC